MKGRLRTWMAVAVLLVGCGTDRTELGQAATDAAVCERPCGPLCCDGVDQVCHDGACCTPRCEGRRCGSDGCGGQCGACATGERCDEATGQCEPICIPEDRDALCARHQKQCGATTLMDNCGESRAVDCGACTRPQTCDAVSNQCRCVAEPAEEFCAALGVECGPASGPDVCGSPRTVNECGPCPARQDCDPSGHCQPCTPGDDDGLCRAAQADCGTLVARDGCGDERTIASCGDCALPALCSVNACGPAPVPENDDCAGALELSFVAGWTLVEGQTTGATDSGSARGCPGSGGDVVYTFTTTAVKDFDARVTPSVPLLSVLSLRSDCADPLTERTCSRAQAGPGFANALAVRRLPAGTYYLWVDTDEALYGVPFALEVMLGDLPPPPANDTCASALELPAGPGAVNGSTWDAADNYAGSCGTLDGPDVVYRFVLAADASATFVLKRSALDPGFEPALSLRSPCEVAQPADEVGCARSTLGTATLHLPLLTAGTYYLVVDGAAGSAGDFQLETTLGAPVHNDVCATAEELVFSGSVATAAGDTSRANDDAFGTCTFGGRDVVYYFTTDSLKTAEFTVTALEAGFTPSVYLRAACESGEIANGCALADTAGGTARLPVARLLPGTWYLWVDGNGTSQGSFALQVTLNEPPRPPANDVCAFAEPIALDAATGRGTVSGTTMWATDDATGSCGAMNGRDLAYSVTLSSEAMLAVRLVRDPADPSYSPAVVVRGNCPVETDELACAVGALGTATAATALLPSGTYFILVDGMQASFGSFTLEVTASPAPAHDTCAAPLPLSFNGAQVATATGDTNQAADDYSAVCAGSVGKDFVYTFTLSQPQAVEATVRPGTGSPAKHVVAIRSGCEAVSSERGCAAAPSNGSPATARVNRLPAGDYYVVVDGATATDNGPFTLEVSLLPPPTTAPANDDCASAQPLTFDGSGLASVTGDTTDASDDLTGTCATSSALFNGNDVVFTVTLSAPAQLSAKVTREVDSPTFNPAVYLRTTCGPSLSGEIACARNSGSTAVGSFPAGTYYVVVDGQNGTAGRFTLQVTKGTPVPGDGCANPLPLTFDAQGVATATGNLASANSNANGPCNPTTGVKDLVYAFTLAAEKDVSVRASAASGSTYRPSIFLRTDCADPGAQLSCAYSSVANTPVTIDSGRLAPGTYYLWVDAYNTGFAGAFEVTLTATDPLAAPANDRCARPEPLTIDASTGHGQVTGDTTWASDDSQGTCGAGQHTGPDLVYAFTVSRTSMFSASITPQAATAGFLPALYLRRNCGGAPQDELACASATLTAMPSLSIAALPSGSYLLFVDGVEGGRSGRFTLDVFTRAPLANDLCAGAEPLVFDSAGLATALGDTTLATAGDSGTCSSLGPDLIYSVTTSAEKSLELTLKPGSAMQPTLHVRATCEQRSTEIPAGCALGVLGTPLTMRIPRLAAGTWYIWVDSVGGRSGPFQLEARLTEVPAIPNNDTCARSEPLDFGATTRAVASGDTTYGDNSIPGTCENADGPDVVYRFTLNDARSVKAKVTRNAASTTFRPVVSIHSQCAGAGGAFELACAKTSTATATATANNLAAGTYYVWVDGAAATFGAFDLELTIAAPITAMANDACATAAPLTFNGQVATATGNTTDAQDDATGRCGPPTGPDVVYWFSTVADQKVTASLSATGFGPMVYLRRSCGSPLAADEPVCGYNATSNTTASATAKVLPAGTYYVWVDGVTGGKGAFSLTVTLGAPDYPPANDSCAGAIPLTRGVVEQGDTTQATNGEGGGTLSSTCAPIPGTTAMNAPDLIYTYTPSVAEHFWVTLTPAPGFNAAVWMTEGVCGGEGLACIAISPRSGTTTTRTLSYQGVGGTTYYIVVDGYSGSGPFSIVVQ